MTFRPWSHPRWPAPGRVGSLLLASALTACAPSTLETNSLGWLAAASPKTLAVEQADLRHVVLFDTDRAELPAAEQDRLLDFLDSIDLSERDSIRIDGHADERAGDLYNLELGARRTETVAKFLRQHSDVDLEIVSQSFGERVPAAAASGPAAWQRNRRVEVVVSRFVVTPPACPDWSRASGVDFDNQPHTNLGCATQTNLGLMIAEPRDLVAGRPLAGADGVHQAKGIARYREGKVTEPEQERIQ